jgi:hydantoinase/carbamoylase family amidase
MGLIGSTALASGLDENQANALRDEDGISLADALRRAELDPTQLPAVRRKSGDIAAFVELHIEQGPRLELEGKAIGVVTGIAGPTNLRVTFEGSATHAGATPMRGRRDALVGTAEIVLAVENAARATLSETTVGTVGSVRVFPGAPNVIPGRVVFSVDVRDHDLKAKRQALAAVQDAIEEVAYRRNLAPAISTILDMEPADMDPCIRAVVREACDSLQLPYVEMVSAAFHDALNLARIAPTAMIFIPSRRGISHNPEEWSEPSHIVDGVRVLTMTVATLAEG